MKMVLYEIDTVLLQAAEKQKTKRRLNPKVWAFIIYHGKYVYIFPNAERLK